MAYIRLCLLIKVNTQNEQLQSPKTCAYCMCLENEHYSHLVDSTMFQGISLTRRRVPDYIIPEIPGLRERVHRRGPKAEPELWLMRSDVPRVLPVERFGRWEILPWAGDIPREELSNWAASEPQRVQVPADLGCDSGVWWDIREGIEAVVIEGRDGPAVHLLTQDSSHYYAVMCAQSPRMPVLVDQWV